MVDAAASADILLRADITLVARESDRVDEAAGMGSRAVAVAAGTKLDQPSVQMALDGVSLPR